MSLSRRDFQAIAQALLGQQPGRFANDSSPDAHEQWQRDCNAVAYAPSILNPNFDRQRFLAACQATTEPQS